jgi:ribosome-interacting GTPase 1
MPTNVTPEYKADEAVYRKARDPRERLEGLREMLRLIPKHKGTDHLQGDIKRRIKELSEELERTKKGGGHGGPALVVRPEGAAQVALLGPPNSGKSSLHTRLTGSNARVGPYPFTTQHPEPGMMPHEDIHFQLVDLPAVSPEHPIPWLASTLQSADACMLVVDLADPGCIERISALHALLRARKVGLSEHWDAQAISGAPLVEVGDDPFALLLPTLLLANKCEGFADATGELRTLIELSGLRFPAFAVSALTGHGLSAIGPWLFENLGVVRVYTKTPGKPLEHERPFVLRCGQTVEDVARLVHHDLVRTLKHARVWHRGSTSAMHVGREHKVLDGDVIELHA